MSYPGPIAGLNTGKRSPCKDAGRGTLFRIQEDGGERPVRFHLFQNGFGALTEGQVDVLIEKIEVRRNFPSLVD